MKRIIIYILSIFVILIIIPVIITIYFHKPKYSIDYIEYIDDGENIEVNSDYFENYIKGVVAAEMPALFHIEALKAQAVAARTYAVKRINEGHNIKDIDQAYLDSDELKKRWGEDNFYKYYTKISSAVDDTKGEIIEYNNEPIEAVFHATSAGYTQNSEDVWRVQLPYLKSVESIGDTYEDSFISEKRIEIKEFVNLLEEKYDDIIIKEDNILEEINIIEQNDIGYVKKIKIGNKEISGNDFRNILGLRSNNFSIRIEENNIIFTTKGYGHGAGMSQTGANYLANTGYNYKEILLHYYKDVYVKKYE